MTTARSIARELAVIVLPQLPKNLEKLEKIDFEQLTAKATRMLVDYAKQSLADANALVVKASDELTEIEVEHKDNQESVEELKPVALTSKQLRQQLDQIERSIHFVAEALDVPDLALHCRHSKIDIVCKSCKKTNEYFVEREKASDVADFVYLLVSTYYQHKDEIDEFLKQSKSKWRLERMISIDRDILRLACAEAFYLTDIPLPVTINEAVELCHRFADERAARFINGILHDVAVVASHFRRTGEMLAPEQAEEKEPLLELEINELKA